MGSLLDLYLVSIGSLFGVYGFHRARFGALTSLASLASLLWIFIWSLYWVFIWSLLSLYQVGLYRVSIWSLFGLYLVSIGSVGSE